MYLNNKLTCLRIIEVNEVCTTTTIKYYKENYLLEITTNMKSNKYSVSCMSFIKITSCCPRLGPHEL